MNDHRDELAAMNIGLSDPFWALVGDGADGAKWKKVSWRRKIDARGINEGEYAYVRSDGVSESCLMNDPNEMDYFNE